MIGPDRLTRRTRPWGFEKWSLRHATLEALAAVHHVLEENRDNLLDRLRRAEP